jgi:hypothetical protein
MIDVTEWLPLGTRYEASPEGFVRVLEKTGGGPAGRLLLPCWAAGDVVYLLRPDRDKVKRGQAVKQTPLAEIVRQVWGLDVKHLTRKALRVLRAEIQAHNEECFPEIRERARKLADRDPFKPGGDCMPCPWATAGKLDADALPPEIDTWNCPEMDPLNHQANGVWVDIGPRRSRPRKTVRMTA